MSSVLSSDPAGRPYLLLAVLIERFELAVRLPAVGLSVRQWARLLAAVLPEVYADWGCPGGPTTHRPGSEGKRRIVAERRRLGLCVHHPLDAEAVAGDGRG